MSTAISADGTATYSMDGTKKYVNSGFMWPECMSPPGFTEISTFTVKFEDADTYDYVCALHPWMTGRVIVNRPPSILFLRLGWSSEKIRRREAVVV